MDGQAGLETEGVTGIKRGGQPGIWTEPENVHRGRDQVKKGERMLRVSKKEKKCFPLLPHQP